ncbi:7tm Odorant receptor [Popillia japonica]|uniref:7tm Odorant receptor n=1 Tax=Popillia japonica TaxID=7064 RepID=A0AAW1KJ91_POPJA
MLYRYFSIAMMAFLAMFSVLPAIVDIGIMMIPASFNIGKYDKPYRIWHMFYTCFIAYNSAAYDTLYMTLIYFGAAQINILEERLKNLYEDTIKISSGFQYSKTQECVSRKILRECIVLHNLINRISATWTSLILPILENTNFVKIIGLCGYSSTIFAQMTAYHWLANEIIFKSEKIIESCYLSSWYKLDVRSQKYLLLLTERAKRPLIITVYKIVFISLASLGVVRKQH